jgi:hypothetical protein
VQIALCTDLKFARQVKIHKVMIRHREIPRQ